MQATAAGAILLEMSLPVASNFQASRQGSGYWGNGGTQVGNTTIYADATNDRMGFAGSISDTASRAYNFHFTYLVV